MTTPVNLELERQIDEALEAQQYETAHQLAGTYLSKAGFRSDDDRAPALSTWFRARWLAAQTALASGRLDETLDCAAPLLPVASCLPPKLACRLWLLVAEAQARRNRPQDARAALDRVQTTELAPVARSTAALLLRACRIRLWLGDVGQLGADLDDCDRALGQDTTNRALLWCECGHAWEAAGDTPRAEECWRKALALCPDTRHDAIRADVQTQLGRVARMRGNLQSALDHYDQAEAVSPQTPARAEIALRRLLVWLDLNQWNRAASAFDALVPGGHVEALPVESRPLAKAVAVVLGRREPEGDDVEVTAFAALGRGDQDRARTLYLQALEQETHPSRKARLSLLLARLSSGTEQHRLLAEAERLARTHHLVEVLWRALEARGSALATHADNDTEARRCFEEVVLIQERQAGALREATVAVGLHRSSASRLLLRSAALRGDAGAAFRYQELDRGRLLYELCRNATSRAGRFASPHSPQLEHVDRCLADSARLLKRQDLAAEAREELESAVLWLRQQQRRLQEEYLADRSRRPDSALPALPTVDELCRRLPQRAVYAAPSLVQDEWFLVLARREGAEVRKLPGKADAISSPTRQLRTVVERELRQRCPNGRTDLDACLEELGHGPLGDALSAALRPGERLIWVPEGDLYGLPIAALRRGGRYLVERNEVVHGFSGALYVHQATHLPRSRRAWGPSVVVAEAPTELPSAGLEADGVAAALSFVCRLTEGAARRDVLRELLRRARVAHFACHACFDPDQALAAFLQLPSGEEWRTLDWLDESFADLPLVTLSACRSAEVGQLMGREVFGLVTGVLAAGVRAVVAGLWPVSDEEAVRFTWRFYRHRMTTNLATALARTQRDAMHDRQASPLFWGVFGLYGDAEALPAPGLWGRWWGRWRQARHARRFPAEQAAKQGENPEPW